MNWMFHYIIKSRTVEQFMFRGKTLFTHTEAPLSCYPRVGQKPMLVGSNLALSALYHARGFHQDLQYFGICSNIKLTRHDTTGILFEAALIPTHWLYHFNITFRLLSSRYRHTIDINKYRLKLSLCGKAVYSIMAVWPPVWLDLAG